MTENTNSTYNSNITYNTNSVTYSLAIPRSTHKQHCYFSYNDTNITNNTHEKITRF